MFALKSHSYRIACWLILVGAILLPAFLMRNSVARAQASSVQASLVNTIDTSKWSAPSPDPSGITYWPARNHLMIVDGEVDEMPNLFTGDNIFEATLSGSLVETYTTLGFSNEPIGIDIAVNPGNGHFFISDDGKDKVFDINPGSDGRPGTADDSVTSFSTLAFGNGDPEGLTFGQGKLYIVDGDDKAVYVLIPGANGRFDGVAPAGDDQVSHFDVGAFGQPEPEGIEFNPETSTLYIVSNDRAADLLEVTTTGTLVRVIDITFLNARGVSDVTRAPSSQNAGVMNLYITARGIDNNVDPNENDGKIYEITLGGSPPPTTDAIFADGFEGGNFSAWTASTTDSGDLSVSSAAALVGTRGMQAVLDDNNPIYVTDDRPSAEPRYRARFYFDPNSIVMTSGNAHYIFQGYTGSSTAVVRVEFRFSNGVYQFRTSLRKDDGNWTSSSWFTISDAAHFVEIDWRAASAAGANDGGLTLWIDGTQRANLTGVDNDTRRIDRIRLGAVAGVDSGTRGTYYFDAFESRRQTYIGP